FDRNDLAKRRERIAEHLTFLPNATIESIESHCATGEYTHVHILAHGSRIEDAYDFRYGLLLHDARDLGRSELVLGARLATALRGTVRSGGNGLVRPAVVTLASCNSGNVGSVAGAGSSVAHAIHDAGIPMVVAGQFPLSFAGSVRMVEVMYEGLLWGRDPRVVLCDLRRRLHSQFSETHDWASIAAYAALPPDFEKD